MEPSQMKIGDRVRVTPHAFLRDEIKGDEEIRIITGYDSLSNRFTMIYEYNNKQAWSREESDLRQIVEPFDIFCELLLK